MSTRALSALIQKHAAVVAESRLDQGEGLADALIWFERVWAAPESSWPDPALIDKLVARIEQQYIDGQTTWHAPLVALFTDFQQLLEKTGAFVEQIDCEFPDALRLRGHSPIGKI